MAFSSVQFLFVFLPLSLAVYWVCPRRLRNLVLDMFSLLFFAWAGLKGAAILVLLAGINWLGGLSLGRLTHKRPLLALLTVLNLAVLSGFRYAGFAAQTLNAVAPGLLPALSPALPLGISFYVLTAIGYCADVAAGRAEPEKSPSGLRCFWPSSAMARPARLSATASRPRSLTPAAQSAVSRPTASATASSGWCWGWPKKR